MSERSEKVDTLGSMETMAAGEDWKGRQVSEAVTLGGLETIRGVADGIMLAGRYRVVKRLGEGGMGSVWLAEDAKLDGKLFAIKMLPAVLAGKKGAYRQVKAEALMAMKLSHPNIATVRAFEEDEGGNPFLVMDYIEGKGLDDILAERGPLSEEETRRILGPVATALDYAHSQGVVHRDVKPGNVMVRKDGTPFVLDFGIAREVQETMTRVTGKLSSGTLLYMSPEQLHGYAPKAAQDVYSFAAMAYESLRGRPPFARGQIEYQIDHDMPVPLEEGVASKEVRDGIMAGLAKEPEKRPGSCAGVLGANIEGKRSKVGGRRSGGRVWVLAALVAAGVGVGVWQWQGMDASGPSAPPEETRQDAASPEFHAKEIKVSLATIPAELVEPEPPHVVGEWFVDAANGNDDNDGRSWATAKKNIQMAIDESSEGETILVADGTYAPITTDNKAITIRSVNGARRTVINGYGTSQCAKLGNDAGDHSTILDGFTITNGYVSLSANTAGGAGVRGGTVKNSIICNCKVGGRKWGGYGGTGGGAWGSRLEDCVVQNCSALAGGGLNSGIAYRCSFFGNYARDDGGALRLSHAIDCLIIGNEAYNIGGKWAGAAGYGVTNINCTIVGNHARSGGIVAPGTLMNCILYDNQVDSGNITGEAEMLSCWTTTPGFVDAENGDYRLGAGSPCIDSGNNEYVISATNLDGNTRIANGTVDIGCYEYGASSGDGGGKLVQAISFEPIGVQTTTRRVELSATATSGGVVTFEVASGPGKIEGKVLSFTGAGDVVVRAVQAGDDRWLPTSVTQTVVVGVAGIWQTGTWADGSWQAAAGNLIRGKMPSQVANSYAGKETGDAPSRLTNGSITSSDINGYYVIGNGASLTYNLVALSAISEIRFYAAWRDRARNGVCISSIEVSVDGKDWVTLPNSSVNISSRSSNRNYAYFLLGPDVEAQFVRIHFGNHDYAYTGYAEIEVLGKTAPEGEDLYLVVDLSGGAEAATWPVEYLDGEPVGGFNADEYKTTKLVLRRIGPGTFMMGSPNSESGRGSDEIQHEVTLSKPYYIGLFEVTQNQYRLVTGGNPSHFKGGTRPVERIKWNDIRGDSDTYNWPDSSMVDANSFVGRLQKRTGLMFDLPTEAQWEYACRAGSEGPYAGTGKLDDMGYYKGHPGGSSKVVGQKQPNAWGLYDMHGNVWEWCADWYTNDWGTLAVTNPSGPTSGVCHVIRGGGWGSPARWCRSASRSHGDGNNISYTHDRLGFRLAMVSSDGGGRE